MIWTFLLNFVIAVLNIVFSFLPVVTAEPSIAGIDTESILQSFSGTIHGVVTMVPLVSVPWYCMLFLISVAVALLGWDFVKWIISLIRG